MNLKRPPDTTTISNLDLLCVRIRVQTLRTHRVLRAISKLTEWLAELNDGGIREALDCLEEAEGDIDLLNQLTGIPIAGAAEDDVA